MELNLDVLTWKEKNFIKDHFFDKLLTYADLRGYFEYDSQARKSFDKLISFKFLKSVSGFSYRICRENIYYDELS